MSTVENSTFFIPSTTKEYFDKEMKHLLLLQNNLSDVIRGSTNHLMGYKIEQILKTNEQKIAKNGLQSLHVEPATREKIITFHQAYIRNITLSTKFVERLPGLIIINQNHQVINDLVININKQKAQLLDQIKEKTNGFEEFHEYIHTLFPGIMTDHLRRSIFTIDHHISNAWFNWANKPINTSMSVDNAISFLERQIDNPKNLFTQEQWQSLIYSNINTLREGRFSKVIRPKSSILLPIMSYKFIDSTGINKRGTKNANTPFLLMAQENNQSPIVSNLSEYQVNNDKPERKPRQQSKKITINQYLNLVGVLDDKPGQ